MDLDIQLVFLQAEDGIRDTSVTGVQTCALPISSTFRRLCSRAPRTMSASSAIAREKCPPDRTHTRSLYSGMPHTDAIVEIGRASCRERTARRVVALRYRRVGNWR